MKCKLDINDYWVIQAMINDLAGKATAKIICSTKADNSSAARACKQCAAALRIAALLAEEMMMAPERRVMPGMPLELPLR